MLDEDLTDLPLQQEIRENLRAMIAAGHDPLEVAEAAIAVAGALALSVEGPARTGAMLAGVGAAMLSAASDVAERFH